MRACAFCGRDNKPDTRFCIDCGKALSATLPATSVIVGAADGSRPCPHCAARIDPTLPFCAHCGQRVHPGARRAAKPARFGGTARTNDQHLALLTATGAIEHTFVLPDGEGVVGRFRGDITLADDVYLSPMHAQFSWRDGTLWIRDLGSQNGTWVFLDGPHRLSDGDVVLIGKQRLHFRRLGYPAPNAPAADRTRRLGSATPSADVALLAQLRADGSIRDTFHLSPGRSISIGRDGGDWVFPYDPTMSGQHAEVRSEDTDFILADTGSRSGIAVAVRGETALKPQQRVLLGEHILRVEPQ